MARRDKNLAESAKGYFSGMPYWSPRRVWDWPAGRLWLVPGGYCPFTVFPRNGLHYHDYFEWCLVLSGSGRFRHGDETWQLKRGDGFLAEPGIAHEIDSLETRDLRVWFCSFGWEPTKRGPGRSESPSQASGASWIHPFLEKHHRHQPGLQRLFPYLELLGTSDDGAAKAVRDSLFLALLTEVVLAFTPASVHASEAETHRVAPPDPLRRALAALDGQLEGSFSLSAVACRSAPSPGTFGNTLAEPPYNSIPSENSSVPRISWP
jgi:hypothetical protein